MKTSILNQKGLSPEMFALISRLVSLIPWPDRRQAMVDVTMTILDGKSRVAEEVFGWSRSSVSVGMSLRGITLAMSNPPNPSAEWTTAGSQGATATDISATIGADYRFTDRFNAGTFSV